MNVSMEELTGKMTEEGIKYRESNSLMKAVKAAAEHQVSDEQTVMVTPSIKFIFAKNKLVRFTFGNRNIRVYNPVIKEVTSKKISIQDGDKKYDLRL